FSFCSLGTRRRPPKKIRREATAGRPTIPAPAGPHGQVTPFRTCDEGFDLTGTDGPISEASPTPARSLNSVIGDCLFFRICGPNRLGNLQRDILSVIVESHWRLPRCPVQAPPWL